MRETTGGTRSSFSWRVIFCTFLITLLLVAFRVRRAEVTTLASKCVFNLFLARHCDKNPPWAKEPTKMELCTEQGYLRGEHMAAEFGPEGQYPMPNRLYARRLKRGVYTSRDLAERWDWYNRWKASARHSAFLEEAKKRFWLLGIIVVCLRWHKHWDVMRRRASIAGTMETLRSCYGSGSLLFQSRSRSCRGISRPEPCRSTSPLRKVSWDTESAWGTRQRAATMASPANHCKHGSRCPTTSQVYIDIGRQDAQLQSTWVETANGSTDFWSSRILRYFP